MKSRLSRYRRHLIAVGAVTVAAVGSLVGVTQFQGKCGNGHKSASFFAQPSPAYACNTPTFPTTGGTTTAATTTAATTTGTTTGPGPGLTDYYVATTGSDSNNCLSSVTACLTFQRACNVATSAGGARTVSMAVGNYGAQNLTRYNGCDPSASVYYLAEANLGVHVLGSITLGGNNGQPSGDAPNYLTFDGISIEQGRYMTHFNGTTNPPHDLGLRNSRIWCTSGSSDCPGGHLIQLRSTLNFIGVNVEAGPYCCDGDGIELEVPRFGAPSPTNISFDRFYVHSIYDTCNNMPSAEVTQYGCSGLGFGDGQPLDHADGIQAFGGINVAITRSRFYTTNPQSTVGGQGIFFQEANGGTFSNLTFQNNMVSCGCGTNTFSLGGPGTGVFTGYIHFYYNTVKGNGIKIYDSAPNSLILASGTDVKFVGNIYTGLVHDTLSTSCTYAAAGGGTVTPLFKNNLASSNTCDATDILGSPTLVNPSIFTPDYRLSGTQAATNSGESTYCPATDLFGTTRPLGGTCDRGAHEAS